MSPCSSLAGLHVTSEAFSSWCKDDEFCGKQVRGSLIRCLRIEAGFLCKASHLPNLLQICAQLTCPQDTISTFVAWYKNGTLFGDASYGAGTQKMLSDPYASVSDDCYINPACGWTPLSRLANVTILSGTFFLSIPAAHGRRELPCTFKEHYYNP